jgi:hypothetical protein
MMNRHRLMKKAYIQQKGDAKKRDIEFKLTFEEWSNWWSNDFENRGVGSDKLVMARIGDVGAYELSNIKKITFGDNSRECRSNHGAGKTITFEGRTYKDIIAAEEQTEYNRSQIYYRAKKEMV